MFWRNVTVEKNKRRVTLHWQYGRLDNQTLSGWNSMCFSSGGINAIEQQNLT